MNLRAKRDGGDDRTYAVVVTQQLFREVSDTVHARPCSAPVGAVIYPSREGLSGNDVEACRHHWHGDRRGRIESFHARDVIRVERAIARRAR